MLVGALVLLVAASVVYLLYARGVFEPSQRLVLLSDDAEGVTVGMDLTFAGFPIGRVRAIELSDDGTSRIVIDVPRRDARWLRESSVFTLTRGLVGNTNLRAFSGVLSDPPLPAGAERRVLVGDATAEIPRLVAETRDLIRNLSQLTSSDSALPKALENMEKFGVPRKIVSFVIPTGYTFNLDGTTLYLSLASVFVAQAANMHMSLGTQITMCLILMLTSKGVAAVPRASLVILIATADQFQLPLWPIAAIFGIDELMDMARTSVNVIGNTLASCVIARWEGEFDDKKALAFNEREADAIRD